MAAQIGSLFVSLVADVKPYTQALQRAQSSTSSAASAIRRDVGLTERSVAQFSRSSQQIKPYGLIQASRAFEGLSDRSGLLRGALIALTGVFGGFAAALSTNIVLRYADSFTKLTNQIRVVSKDSNEAARSLAAVAEVADASRSGLKETAILFSRLSFAAPGRGANEILQYVQTIQKALQLGGATTEEASSAAIQFSQAVASNRLSGDEIRAVLETPLGLQLAKGLGVTIGKLREMGRDGKLTADVILEGLRNISKAVDDQFNNSVITLDQSIVVLDNHLTTAIGKFNQSYGITRLLSQGILGLAHNADQAVGIIAALGGVLGTVFASRLLGRGVNGIQNRITSSIAGTSNFVTGRRDAVAAVQGHLGDLRGQRLQAGLAANAARRSTADPYSLAPRSAQSAYEREGVKLQKLDETRLALNDKLRQSYQKLGEVTVAMPARAVAMTEKLVAAEKRLADLRDRERLRTQAVGPARAAEAAAIGGKGGVAAMTARVRAEKDVAAAVVATAKQEEVVQKRRVAIAQLAATADVAAAQQRINALHEIDAVQAAQAATDQQRTAQVAQTRGAKAAAEQAGVAVARENVAQTAGVYRALGTQVAATEVSLVKATAAASRMGIAVGLAGRAWRSFEGFLGGPWGVAIAGAIGLVTLLGIRSAASAQKTADAVRRTGEILAEAGLTPGDQRTGSQQAAAATKYQNDIADVKADIKQQVDLVNSSIDTINDKIKIARSGFLGAFTVSEDAQNQIKQLVQQFQIGAVPLEDFQNKIRAIFSAEGITRVTVEELIELAIHAHDGGDAVRLLNEKLVDLSTKGAPLDGVAARFKAMSEAAKEAADDVADLNLKVQESLADIGTSTQANLLRGQGKEAEARTFEEEARLNKGAKGGATIDAAQHALILGKEQAAIAAEKSASAFKGENKELERTATIIDKIKRESEGAFLGDIDREVIDKAANIQNATKLIREYIDAVSSGDPSKAPKELQGVRSAVLQAHAADQYRDLIKTYGTASQLVGQFADEQEQLNYLVGTGKITAEQAGVAWADFVGSFGEYKWIDDVASAFGDFAHDAIFDFGNIADSAKNFLKRLEEIALQVIVIEPLVRQLRATLAGGAGAGGSGFLGSIVSALSSSFGGGVGTGGIGPSVTGVGGLYHSGTGNSSRVIDMSAFAGAPRFHGGRNPKLYAGERPAIIRNDEMVLTADQQKSAANSGNGEGKVEIITPPGASVSEDRAASGRGMRRFVISMVGQGIVSGELDGAMAQRHGIQPRKKLRG